MRLAVIADIHANINSLRAVLKDIKTKGTDSIVCLGDLVGYCTSPNEVIDLIRSNNVLTIMGNYDEAVGNELMVCGCDYSDPKDLENAGLSLNWTIDTVTEENKNYLRQLPREAKISFEGKTVRFVHGSPRLINEYLKENSPEAQEVMSSLEEDVLVCGHTHIPYYRIYGGKLLVNAGSAGKPKTGSPDANYMVLNITKEEVKVEIISVPYDYESTALEIEKNGLPQAFAEIIRTGRG